MQKAARRIIRRIAALGPEGDLRIRGLIPGPCWDATHLDKAGPGPRLHWDMSAILDFAEWTRQQLGPDWRIAADPEIWGEHPAMAGLFRENGFRNDEDDGMADDDE